MEPKPKYAVFKSHQKVLEVSRYGREIYQWLGFSQSVKHIYASVARAKASMEQARVSGNLLPADVL